MKIAISILSISVFALSVGCTKKTATESASPEQVSAEALVAKGKAAYQSNCIACHNPNPSIDGALGPAVAGSSRELLEARVLTASYPSGYTPKRTTVVMAALPHLKNDIDALTAYLNSGKYP
ncbi:MAG TPA: cytochrome c [Bdellovibrionales bacterium]|nr:cytochrome c [Bdellovibrionales bacterium]